MFIPEAFMPIFLFFVFLGLVFYLGLLGYHAIDEQHKVGLPVSLCIVLFSATSIEISGLSTQSRVVAILLFLLLLCWFGWSALASLCTRSGAQEGFFEILLVGICAMQILVNDLSWQHLAMSILTFSTQVIEARNIRRDGRDGYKMFWIVLCFIHLLFAMHLLPQYPQIGWLYAFSIGLAGVLGPLIIALSTPRRP